MLRGEKGATRIAGFDMEGGPEPRNTGVGAASKHWKRPGNPLLEPPEGAQPANTLIFAR